MKKLTAEQFQASFSADPDEARIYFRDYQWEAHCTEGVLAMPNGQIGFPNLPGLLSILAGIGIRRMDVEWDGLPAWHFDQSSEVAG